MTKKSKTDVERSINGFGPDISDEKQAVFVGLIFVVHNQNIRIVFENFKAKMSGKIEIGDPILIIVSKIKTTPSDSIISSYFVGIPDAQISPRVAKARAAGFNYMNSCLG